MIRVHDGNNLEIAKMVIGFLKEKKFSITTCHLTDGNLNGLPQVLRDLELSEVGLDDFGIKDRAVRIPLAPSRTIYWDLEEGDVLIYFRDDGVMTLERHLPHDKIIYRVIVTIDANPSN